MSVNEYYQWSEIDDGWICPKCEKKALPFYDASLFTDESPLQISQSHVPRISIRITVLSENTITMNANFVVVNYWRQPRLSDYDDVRRLTTAMTV